MMEIEQQVTDSNRGARHGGRSFALVTGLRQRWQCSCKRGHRLVKFLERGAVHVTFYYDYLTTSVTAAIPPHLTTSPHDPDHTLQSLHFRIAGFVTLRFVFTALFHIFHNTSSTPISPNTFNNSLLQIPAASRSGYSVLLPVLVVALFAVIQTSLAANVRSHTQRHSVPASLGGWVESLMTPRTPRQER
jgi:hypothetical protein